MKNWERWLYLTVIAGLGLALVWQWRAAPVRSGSEPAGGPPFLACSNLGIANLKAQGLADPVADLIADLKTRTELIPFQPVGGGEPRVSPWLINCPWVLAVVEDGHKGVLVILDYQVDNGRIKWTVRAAEQ